MDLGMGFDPDSAEDISISVKGGFFWAPWLLQASEVLIFLGFMAAMDICGEVWRRFGGSSSSTTTMG
jgi:hypothetical protein